MIKSKIKMTPLHSHTGLWMRIVSNNISYAFARKLAANNITVAEWVILRSMYDGDDTSASSTIADLTGLTRGAVSKLMTRLFEKGLVTRQESSADRRYQDIKLTQEGLDLIPHLSKLADQNEEEFFSELNSKERATLHEILTKLASLHKLTKMPIN